MNAQLVHRSELTSNDMEAMFRLLAAHFVGVERRQFECDLSRKDWTVLARDDQENLTAFTTFAMYRTSVYDCESPVSVVCSGDTIVDQSKPPCTALLRTWLQSILTLHEPNRHEPLYWLLIVSGFRTYRFLPVFWRTFYPNVHEQTPTPVQELIDALASERFGADYDSRAGIVRFPRPQILRGELNGIPLARIGDPHIDFFGRKNPGHAQGDELVCLTEIHADNLTAAGRRMANARRSQALAAVGA